MQKTFCNVKAPQNKIDCLSYYCCIFSTGCNDCAASPSGLIMPLSNDEPMCPKFQPNIFDPSRCHDCLRQRHLHAGTGESTEAAPQPKSTAETELGAKTGTDTGVGLGKGVSIIPIPSQTEERDTSSKVREKREEGGNRSRMCAEWWDLLHLKTRQGGERIWGHRWSQKERLDVKSKES